MQQTVYTAAAAAASPNSNPNGKTAAVVTLRHCHDARIDTGNDSDTL